jgi:hypothetical protein
VSNIHARVGSFFRPVRSMNERYCASFILTKELKPLRINSNYTFQLYLHVAMDARK